MLGTVLSIDPGLRKCGCALWCADGTLRRAWTARAPAGTGRGLEAWVKMVGAIKIAPTINTLVVEQMQIYRDKKTSADDLLELTGVLGSIAWRFSGATKHGYKPAEWKGQVPKRVMRDRLKKRLTAEELLTVDGKCTHDTWDAIGIGAYYFRKKGVERWQRRR